SHPGGNRHGSFLALLACPWHSPEARMIHERPPNQRLKLTARSRSAIRPDKPLLMAPGRTAGFGFLTNVAINPHLTSAKRDAELVNVVDAHPEVLGIGIDDDAALIVRKNGFEVIGTGKVAIYDNVR